LNFNGYKILFKSFGLGVKFYSLVESQESFTQQTAQINFDCPNDWDREISKIGPILAVRVNHSYVCNVLPWFKIAKSRSLSFAKFTRIIVCFY
jgi:hypothetical protein